MKTFFATVLFLLTFVVAQAGSKQTLSKATEENLHTQAIEQTRQLAGQLGLNEAEYIKVKNITFQKLVALQQTEEMYAQNTEVKAKKQLQIQQNFNEQLAGALSAKQHRTYMAMAN